MVCCFSLEQNDGDFRVNMYRRAAGDFGIRRSGSNWRGGYNDVSKVTDRVTDRVTDGVTDGVTDREQEIIFLLLEDAGYTMPQLAEKLNISRKTVAARLKVLKEKGIIERVGSDRKGYWKVHGQFY